MDLQSITLSFYFFTVCSIKNMPLLGNFSDTCCIHCCYKNIVPPHLIMLYLLTFILHLFLPPPMYFFPIFCLNPCSRRYLLKSELSIFCDYFIFWCFLKFHSVIFLQFLSLKLLKRLSFFDFV